MHLFGIPFVVGPEYYGPLWFVRDLFLLNVLSFILVPFAKKTPGYVLIPLMVAFYFFSPTRQLRYSAPLFITGIYFGFKKRIESLAGNGRLAADGRYRNRLETGFIQQFQQSFGDLFL